MIHFVQEEGQRDLAAAFSLRLRQVALLIHICAFAWKCTGHLRIVYASNFSIIRQKTQSKLLRGFDASP